MQKDLESKINASKKVTTSVHCRIENELLQENKMAYYECGVKNWSLIGKHVYALQCYSKKYPNGKIPPKHELLHTLEQAIQEFSPAVDQVKSVGRQAQPRKQREFAGKSLLEEHGVEFPERPMSKGNMSRLAHGSCYPMPTSNYSRLLPENEAEGKAQFNLCIRESLREDSIVSTSTVTTRALLSTEPTQYVESSPMTSTSM